MIKDNYYYKTEFLKNWACLINPRRRNLQNEWRLVEEGILPWCSSNFNANKSRLRWNPTDKNNRCEECSKKLSDFWVMVMKLRIERKVNES